MVLEKQGKEKGIFASEVAKVMKKQQGIFILLVFVIIKILLTVSGGYTTHYIIEQNAVVYERYMNEYKGKVTQKKEKAIKQEYENIYFADAMIDEYLRQLEEGKITKEEYQNKCENSYKRLKEKKAFEVFYSKYTYAREEPENRYILDARGWETLLKNDLDYLLIFALVIVISLIFTQETESDMEDILLSTKNGGKSLVIAKLKTGICIGISLFCVFQMIEIGYLLATVGLEGADYPLKSISAFETSNFNISLGKAYVGILLVKILGTVFAVIQILFIALCFKKVIPSMVIAVFILLFPILLGMNGAADFFPFPYVMLKSVSFIQGDIYLDSTLFETVATGLKKNMIEAMTPEKCLLILGVQIIYIIVFTVLIYFTYVHKSLHGQRGQNIRKSKKRIASLFMLFVFLFSGCGKEQGVNNQPKIFEEEFQSAETKIDNYLFQLDKEQNQIIMTDIVNQKNEVLSRNIYEEHMKITAFYVTKDVCYYLKENQIDSGMQLWEIGLTDRKERLIYNSCRKNKQDFYGFIKDDNEIEEIFDSVETSESLFLYQGIYAFWRKGNDLYRLDLREKVQEKFVDDLKEGTYYIVKNDNVFYIDSSYQICVKNLRTREEELLSIYGKEMQVKDKSIYYYDLLQRGEKRKLKY